MRKTKNSTERFSDRVENYVKYRPGYPAEILNLLQSECGLTKDSIVADVGSGTGISAELFLRNGNLVFGVEPNGEMREAGERLLQQHGNRFVSVAGTAEETTLQNGSVDFVVAGQAFHWFQRGKTRKEFVRILKPGGWVILIWNERRTDSTKFLQAYEDLLIRFAIDYHEVNHAQIDEQIIGSFYGATGFKLKRFANHQRFDLEGLKGRLLSCSYVPTKDHPNYKPMLNALEKSFVTHEQNGLVTFEYDTKVFYGRLK